MYLLQGYTGDRCESTNTACNSSPCQNDGICVPQPDGFTCECPAGVAGPACQYDIQDECSSNPCQHGGDCRNKLGQ